MGGWREGWFPTEDQAGCTWGDFKKCGYPSQPPIHLGPGLRSAPQCSSNSLGDPGVWPELRIVGLMKG